MALFCCLFYFINLSKFYNLCFVSVLHKTDLVIVLYQHLLLFVSTYILYTIYYIFETTHRYLFMSLLTYLFVPTNLLYCVFLLAPSCISFYLLCRLIYLYIESFNLVLFTYLCILSVYCIFVVVGSFYLCQLSHLSIVSFYQYLSTYLGIFR